MSAPSFLSLVNAQKAVLIARLAHAVSASPSTAIPSTAPGPRNVVTGLDARKRSGAARRHRQFEETRCTPSITRRSRATSAVPQLLGGTEEDTFSGVSASRTAITAGFNARDDERTSKSVSCFGDYIPTGTHPLVSFLDLHLAPRMRRLVAREGNSATG
ncbi:hypothetical protein B0H16DRAFT_1719275 [Mycena metata]|uniref:Uncharacterized protein n=1 Tax=Mycena metata TaxID=1033252 RepID=A0AAD7JFD9_9AGAR|nr:hypothetical protein B0H16DRAFT_1719219 [Mycena metata]KAJ7762240.1 hypothetical protein B0H16DRAFT_1719275 [Mycena metata]